MYVYGGSYTPAGYRTQLFRVDRREGRAVMPHCHLLPLHRTSGSRALQTRMGRVENLENESPLGRPSCRWTATRARRRRSSGGRTARRRRPRRRRRPGRFAARSCSSSEGSDKGNGRCSPVCTLVDARNVVGDRVVVNRAHDGQLHARHCENNRQLYYTGHES